MLTVPCKASLGSWVRCIVLLFQRIAFLVAEEPNKWYRILPKFSLRHKLMSTQYETVQMMAGIHVLETIDLARLQWICHQIVNQIIDGHCLLRQHTNMSCELLQPQELCSSISSKILNSFHNIFQFLFLIHYQKKDEPVDIFLGKHTTLY